MDIAEELKKPEVAAVAGAVGGLLAATVVPPTVILVLGAATACGAYLYNRKYGKKPDAARGSGGESEAADIAPQDIGKEK